MKPKRYFIISLLIIVVCFFCTGLAYCLIFFRSYNPDLVRNMVHFYSAIFLVFAFTLIGVSQKNTPIKTSDILWGVMGVLALTLTWEIIFQGTKRFNSGQGFYVQWGQIIADLLGIITAIIIWLIKKRRRPLFQ